MKVPPFWVRRPVALALLLVGLVPVLVLTPVLLVGAAILSIFVPGRWRPLRLCTFALVYLLLEVAAAVAALALWIASGFGWRMRSERMQHAHYTVVRWVLHAVVATARRVFNVEVVTDGESWSPLDDGIPGSTNAMIVLCRHAGPGDSVLLLETLMNRDHLRRPRVVLKDTLQLDPLVDVYLNRLPSRFLTTGGSDLADEVGELARGLGEEDAVVIFPEGGNFTPARRERAIRSLREKGLDEQAGQAELMQHMLPPRPGGVQAALAQAPEADVVFVAHTGLEHLSTARDLYRGLPMDTRVLMRWDFFEAEDVPRGRQEQADWLFERWAEMDRWVAERSRRD